MVNTGSTKSILKTAEKSFTLKSLCLHAKNGPRASGRNSLVLTHSSVCLNFLSYSRANKHSTPRFRTPKISVFFFPLFDKIDLRAFKALSTLMFFQKYAFSLSPKKHRSIRVHTTVLMRYRLSTLKRLKTIELHVVKYVLLYAHAADTRACDIFGHHFHFDVFSTVQTNTTCVRFRFDPLSTAFSNRCVFFMKMLGVLVLTERLNASKCTRFETKTH